MFSADQLLNPISESQPAGADLSFAPDLDAIAQARRFDDPSLDQGEWVTDLKEADWDFVVTRCAALLADKSKDLKLAVWLTEAASKRHQLRGLAEGYRVLAGLIERFWDLGLYPEADGDDHDQRIGNLSWILARTPALLREIPLTEGRATAYSTVDFETARKQANNTSGSSGNPAANGQLKLSDLEAAKRNNSAQFCAAFAADARYCMDALLELERASDARLGHDSPGFSTARDAVETMLHAMPATAVAVVDAGANAGNPGAHENGAGFAEPSAGYNVVPVQSGPPGAIQNRTQAIAQLRAVAEFFRRTEPHSPVSYFAEKAANAGEQDLHTWLRSVVKDQSSLAHIEELLGVQPGSD